MGLVSFAVLLACSVAVALPAEDSAAAAAPPRGVLLDPALGYNPRDNWCQNDRDCVPKIGPSCREGQRPQCLLDECYCNPADPANPANPANPADPADPADPANPNDAIVAPHTAITAAASVTIDDSSFSSSSSSSSSSDDDDDDNDDNDAVQPALAFPYRPGSGIPAAAAALAAVDAPRAVSNWTVHKPGGLTGCVHGDEFAFFVRKGTVNKVALYLDGGGACWSYPTCRSPTCTTGLNIATFQHNLEHGNQGIFNLDPVINPLATWTIVAAPYCSCDAHTGNKTANYNFGLIMKHRGRVNVGTAVDWIAENMPNPESVFMTGCSAGSVGSYVWAPHLFQRFPKAQHFHFGDSYGPMFGESGWNRGNAAWDLAGALPSWIPGLSWNKWHKLITADLVSDIANFYPNATFSSYTSYDDFVEVGFYHVEGGGAGDWAKYRDSAFKFIHSNTTNYATFVSKGNNHCVSTTDDLFKTKADGIELGGWVADLVSGNPINMTVDYRNK